MQQRSAKSGRGDVFYSPRQRERSSSGASLTGLDEPMTAWVEGWNQAVVNMYDTWMQAVQTSWEPYLRQAEKAAPTRREQPGHRQHHHACTCERHKHECDCVTCEDDCTCRCCIGDVDLVINSRVGERRVVPIVIENSSRREREVELELSDWTARGGQSNVTVSAAFAGPLKFTLAACAEETLILLVASSSAGETPNTIEVHDSAENRVNRLGDVDTCRVYTADLRVKGCDIRPIRIAVSLLPRDCEPYVIDCHCGCC